MKKLSLIAILGLSFTTLFGKVSSANFYYKGSDYKKSVYDKSNRYGVTLNLNQKIFIDGNYEKISKTNSKISDTKIKNITLKYSLSYFKGFKPEIGYRYSYYENGKSKQNSDLIYLGLKQQNEGLIFNINDYLTFYNHFKTNQLEIKSGIILPTNNFNLIGVKIGLIYISNKSKAGTDNTNYYYSNIYFTSKISNNFLFYGDVTFGDRSLYVENEGTYTNVDGTVKKEYHIGTTTLLNRYNQISVEYQKEFLKKETRKDSVIITYSYRF